MAVLLKQAREEYDAIDGLSPSTIIPALKSAKHWQWEVHADSVSSNAMRLGTMVHHLILEPHVDFQQVAEDDLAQGKPVAIWDGIRRGKAWQEFLAAHADHTILRPKDIADHENAVRDAYAIAAEVLRHPFARELFESSEHEVSLTADLCGAACKGRVDALQLNTPQLLTDLKTTRNASDHPFGSQAAQLHYHVRLGVYQQLAAKNGLEIDDVFVVAVESTPPHDVVVYRVPEPVLDEGWRLAAGALQVIQFAREHGRYDGICPSGFMELYFPNWAMPDELVGL